MLKTLQAATGLLFALFVFAHLANTVFAAFGAQYYDSVQSALRTVYQFAPLEVLLLASLAVHAVIGVMRWVGEPKRQLNARARWHRYAGVFLLVFIVGHVTAVRGSSFFYGVFPQFEGLAYSIDYVPYYFYPYYFLLGLSGFYHALNGSGIALTRLGLQMRLTDVFLKRAAAVGAVSMAAALLGLGGWFFDVGPVYESGFAQLAAELFDLEY